MEMPNQLIQQLKASRKSDSTVITSIHTNTNIIVKHYYEQMILNTATK